MNKMVSYKFDATLEALGTALDPVMDELDVLGVDKKTAYKIRLALDEILTNVVSYAYEDEQGEVEVNYEIQDDPRMIVVNVIDEGKAFNPLEIEDPDLTLDIKDRQIGGLGLFIVKNTMDDVSYVRNNNKNILTIKKLI